VNREGRHRQKLVSFIQLSLDGYLADANGGISWAKANQDAECRAFVERNASGEGLLLFGAGLLTK